MLVVPLLLLWLFLLCRVMMLLWEFLTLGAGAAEVAAYNPHTSDPHVTRPVPLSFLSYC